MKDLLLTMRDVSTLVKAIFQALKCDNRLFERRHSERFASKIRISSFQSTNSVSSTSKPMQIDSLRFKPLTQGEKYCCRY